MRKSLHPNRYAKVRIVVEVLVPEWDQLFRSERFSPRANNTHSARALRYAMSDAADTEEYKLIGAKRTRVLARDLNSDGYVVIALEPEAYDDCEADADDRDDRALLGEDDDRPLIGDDPSDTPVSSTDTNWDFAVV